MSAASMLYNLYVVVLVSFQHPPDYRLSGIVARFLLFLCRALVAPASMWGAFRHLALRRTWPTKCNYLISVSKSTHIHTYIYIYVCVYVRT